jgi:hypothetical protein
MAYNKMYRNLQKTCFSVKIEADRRAFTKAANLSDFSGTQKAIAVILGTTKQCKREHEMTWKKSIGRTVFRNGDLYRYKQTGSSLI